MQFEGQSDENLKATVYDISKQIYALQNTLQLIEEELQARQQKQLDTAGPPTPTNESR